MASKKKYATGIASKANILMAARLCFAQKGFFETSMTDIEKAADTSRGVLYHHFDSKDEMILAIIAENLGLAAQKIEADLQQLQITGIGDLPQLLTSSIHLVEQVMVGPGKAMSVHVWSLSLLRPHIKEAMMVFFERIRQSLKLQLIELQKLGKINKGADLNKLATVVFSIQIPAYIIQRLFTNDDALDPEQFVEALQELFAINASSTEK